MKLTEQIKTDLLCCLYLFPKESAVPEAIAFAKRPIKSTVGFLAFDIVHAVEFSRIGRTGPKRYN